MNILKSKGGGELEHSWWHMNSMKDKTAPRELTELQPSCKKYFFMPNVVRKDGREVRTLPSKLSRLGSNLDSAISRHPGVSQV